METLAENSNKIIHLREDRIQLPLWLLKIIIKNINRIPTKRLDNLK